jgi:hypothetical protein
MLRLERGYNKIRQRRIVFALGENLFQLLCASAPLFARFAHSALKKNVEFRLHATSPGFPHLTRLLECQGLAAAR